MTTSPSTDPNFKYPDPHQDAFSRTVLGFWMYLMTDCILFATLFATYAIAHSNTFGGPSANQLFSLSLSFAETMVLLASSFTCGMGVLAACRQRKLAVLIWLALTLLLGLSFVGLELGEFTHFVQEGHSWRVSAFLSSFFTLVGTHGLHVSIGSLWLAVVIGQIVVHGFTIDTFRRLVCFSMFWHFLDLVWIFIFTFVYLMGIV
jgi:cytochrome o ubiquinol oxidase subunit III